MAPVGVVLAAGRGRRYGGPKAFVRTDSGETWLERTCRVLLDGGCGSVLATLPAGSDDPGLAGVSAVPLATEGLSDSLAGALESLEPDRPAVVMLVDLPDVTAAVVRRVLGAVDTEDPAVLARATYDGRPGHPVVIGPAHLGPLRADLAGDSGANAYLRAHGAAQVECGDLATGEDVDRPR
ncbi:MAG: NTP transferase domain-containing protein [Nocardioidaceae bacterium]|nr:NTP transferase domain-containing protein [Nocardioidaceae bacterium]MCL2614860.1 NTP transferase domain-containing protein [Nocardioidaceae bacterium]